MTQRLNSKDFHSRDHGEPIAPGTNYESNKGIDYNACFESGLKHRFGMPTGCWDSSNVSMLNSADEQQIYRNIVLPDLQIFLENLANAGTSLGAELNPNAGYVEGSAERRHGLRSISRNNPAQGFYEGGSKQPGLYTATNIEGHVADVPAWTVRHCKNIYDTMIDSQPSVTITSKTLDTVAKPITHRTHEAAAAADARLIATAPAPGEVPIDLKSGVTSGPATQADRVPSFDANLDSTDKIVPVPKIPDSQLTISGAPTITPEKINEVLKEYHSPAAGMGQYIYDQGIKHGINPAMALAFYVVESKCGTIGLAVKNKSWGNVRGHGPHGYRPFNNIEESLDDWYRLMGDVYLHKFHADKLKKVVALYSPNSDGNNEASYVHSVGQMVRKWNTST